jgi:xylulose-5-phosphate/fructose-6-phosphate phosphoketolase
MQGRSSESRQQNVLSAQELSRLDAYWRAANYLSVGQIYLLDNPLLREPLKPEHIKPRLLGH